MQSLSLNWGKQLFSEKCAVVITSCDLLFILPYPLFLIRMVRFDSLIKWMTMLCKQANFEKRNEVLTESNLANQIQKKRDINIFERVNFTIVPCRSGIVPL